MSIQPWQACIWRETQDALAPWGFNFDEEADGMVFARNENGRVDIGHRDILEVVPPGQLTALVKHIVIALIKFPVK